MIDLTLDSILIPDITGYTPPFGTKVARTAVNKGGLSTQEVNNNIIASFVKMRGVVVGTSDTTSRIEYDAKIIIEAAEPITLTLGNATYRGCRVTLVNNTEFTHILSCDSEFRVRDYMDWLKVEGKMLSRCGQKNRPIPTRGASFNSVPMHEMGAYELRRSVLPCRGRQRKCLYRKIGQFDCAGGHDKRTYSQFQWEWFY